MSFNLCRFFLYHIIRLTIFRASRRLSLSLYIEDSHITNTYLTPIRSFPITFYLYKRYKGSEIIAVRLFIVWHVLFDTCICIIIFNTDMILPHHLFYLYKLVYSLFYTYWFVVGANSWSSQTHLSTILWWFLAKSNTFYVLCTIL